MPIFYLPNGMLFVTYTNAPILKFRPIISKLLFDKFGQQELTTKQITEALNYSFDWYSNQFFKILGEQNEVVFYQTLFGLHEFASEFAQKNRNQSPIPQMQSDDFALYRRILKLCLEQACDVPLVGNIKFPSNEYLKSKESIIEELLYLGEFLYDFASSISGQRMLEDYVDLKFTTENLFYFSTKHHYDRIIPEILAEINPNLAKAVVDERARENFNKALSQCHNISCDQIFVAIMLMQENNKAQGGKMAMEEWYAYPKNIELLFDIPYMQASQIFKGLTLTKDNKMTLKDAIFKPNNINKYLYRPFLVWNVNGIDRTIVGEHVFNEAIGSLCVNALGWEKYPPEWKNDCFHKYILGKKQINDKLLEDEIENMLKSNNILYDRKVTKLKKWNNRNINIESEFCGEIDFLFLLNNTLFICESKHLIARYDMSNFNYDYEKFEKGEKSFNKIIERKVNYIKQNLGLIEEHFQVKYNDKNLKIKLVNVEGIFAINTPTFIMYNNDFRIYTLKGLKEFVLGKYEDKEFPVLIKNEDCNTLINVKYRVNGHLWC